MSNAAPMKNAAIAGSALPQRAMAAEDDKAAETQVSEVVVTGSMDLLHEGEVIQVLEPGECFGHPSLLTGLAPAFTVRAREPTTCLLLPRGVAMRVFAQPAGAEYLASSLRRRLCRPPESHAQLVWRG